MSGGINSQHTDAQAVVHAWGAREKARFAFRVDLFIRRGIAEGYAAELADRLYERDAERDDRHFCYECAHMRTWQDDKGRDWRCGRGDALLLNQLQRCMNFKWETPKK
jgi:hypothetical protein